MADFQGTERFQVIRHIGTGAMGVVYEARDLTSGRRVALKTLKHMDGRSLLRFKNEFRSLVDIHHPNLVSLGELSESDGEWFFTMEYVPGVDFAAYVRGESSTAADTERDELCATGDFSASSDTDDRTLPAREMWSTRSLPAYDEERLRSALRQLAAGLAALHDAGRVHRDIKPANLRVDPSGRLVVLDFGLVSEADPARQSTDGGLVGTVAYMAPEQANARSVGPAADWYSVGVLLYEALTGRLPHTGPIFQVLVDKGTKPVGRPSLATTDPVPPDLDSLCARLLAISPSERATREQVLEALRVAPRESLAATTQATETQGVDHFVGRDAELAGLDEGLSALSTGRGSAVLLVGESGIGKTALVREFLRRLRASRGPNGTSATVLTGRCYERESVPYKAFDGIVDEISRLMLRADGASGIPLEPHDAALLAQAFPVLRRVRAFARAVPLAGGADPAGLRVKLFDAVRTLLSRLAAARPLVLTIDDLQWADDDSLALLKEVLRVPAPPLYLIATHRGEELERLTTLGLGLTHVHLAPLSPREAAALARSLLGTGRPRTMAPAIAQEAAGHPLFIEELARHVHRGDYAIERPALDDAIRVRISALPEESRLLLEVIAVAGVPIPQSVAARAAALDATESAPRIAGLRAARLVRTSGGAGDDSVEMYHDRVRQAVLGMVAALQRRNHHCELALALEAVEGHQDQETIAGHWIGADEPARALDSSIRAARSSVESFAFGRAARLFEQAFGLMESEDLRRPQLMEERAAALASAGMAQNAAVAYLAASDVHRGSRRLLLRCRAAAQLLQSGRIDDGVQLLREVLGALGFAFPETPRRALASLLTSRARLRLRGLQFRLRDASAIPADDLARIDIGHAAAISLGMADNIRGTDFHARTLLLALKAGEPGRVARALGLEGAFRALVDRPPGRRTRETLAVAERLAAERGDWSSIASVRGAEGIAEYQSGAYSRALALLDESERIYTERCTGVWAEIASVRPFALWSLVQIGAFAECRRRLDLLIREARDRGDLFTATVVRVSPSNLCWLAEDSPEAARGQVHAAMADWSHEGCHLQHFWALGAQVSIDLYCGDAGDLLGKVMGFWPRLERSMLMRGVHQIRLEALELRARAALAAARSEPPRRRMALAIAKRDAAAASREVSRAGRPLASLLRAQILHLNQRTEGSLSMLATCIEEFRSVGMDCHAAVALRARGRVLGGDEGKALVADAERALAGAGVREPRRFAAVLCPAFAES